MSAPLKAPMGERQPGQRWTDHQVDQVIARLLQFGVLVATVVVLLGGTLLVVRGGTVLDLSIFHGETSAMTSVGAILRGVGAMDARAITQLGLVLLILTPIARVALTLAAFILQRDRLYVGLTAIVLVLLLIGLF
ncbi:MAG: DUF1634 domain-containing protein [Gemmatimonadales bacterium]